MTLGSKIKELRNANGLTQKDLSEKLNVTPQAVSRWESDEVEPSVDTIRQMATIFNVTIDELFGNKVEPTVVEKIVDVLKKNKEVYNCCLGALTNVAMAIKVAPKLASRMHIVWMGTDNVMLDRFEDTNFVKKMI